MQMFTDANKPLLDYLDSVGLSQKEIMGYMPHVMTKEFVDKIERAIPRAVNEKSVNGRSKYVGSVSEINAREGEQVFNNNYYVAMRDKMNDLVRYASSKKMSDHVFKNPELAVPYSEFEKSGKAIQAFRSYQHKRFCIQHKGRAKPSGFPNGFALCRAKRSSKCDAPLHKRA